MNLFVSILISMRNCLLLLMVIVLSFSYKRSSAQVPNDELLKVEKAFVAAFNDEAIDAFVVLFDDDMKKRNTTQKLKSSFRQMASQIGHIHSLTLDKTDGNSFTYRSVFQKMATLKVVFYLNDNSKVSKMSISSDYVYKDAPILERNKSDLILPFNDEWYVFWGGKKTSDNYHNAYASMRGAFDFWVMGSNGKSHNNGATKNEDFYAFGKDIIAPVDAKVIYAYDDIPDNNWPAMNPSAGSGNTVLLETKNKEYILLGHLKQNSITVKEGQYVKQGELIGLCGNSGNSTEPHLHFQVQNIPDFGAATGAWTHFKKINVHDKIKEDYIPVRGDKIKN